jgi:hypothetical protein
MAAFHPFPVAAESFVRSARSGVPVRVFTYHSDCSEKFGVIHLVTKPRHGKAVPSRDVSIMQSNRYNPRDRCVGSALKGFRVDYTSAPGFRGVDSFVIEYTPAGRATVTDSFTVNVE